MIAIILIVSLDLSIAEKYVEDIKEFAVVEFHVEATLHAEAFTDHIEFTVADYVMHFADS